MVVHWKKPGANEEAFSLLGRVRVTIQDLDALLDLIQGIEGHKVREIQFSGRGALEDFQRPEVAGGFTLPSDMGKIPLGMLRTLTIEVSGKLYLTLAPGMATAAGRHDYVSAIKAWAQSRQTWIAPQSSRVIVYSQALGSLALVLLAAFNSSFRLIPLWVVILAQVIAFLILGLLVTRVAVTGWARILPIAYEEYLATRWRRTLLQLSPIVVSVLALAASIAFNILNLHKPPGH